jgi:hypothetical protein
LAGILRCSRTVRQVRALGACEGLTARRGARDGRRSCVLRALLNKLPMAVDRSVIECRVSKLGLPGTLRIAWQELPIVIELRIEQAECFFSIHDSPRKEPYQPNNARQQHAEHDACHDWEIEAEILPFDRNVARQLAQPRDRRCKQPGESDPGNQQPHCNQ